MILRHGILPAILLWLLLFTSCDHKPLYIENYVQYRVRVDFDYSQVRQMPGTMRVFFYPTGQQSQQSYKFDLDATGGVVTLPAGDYHVVAYNVDAPNVLEQSSEEYEGFGLTTACHEIEVTMVKNEEGVKVPRRSLFGSKLPIAAEEEPYVTMYESPDWTCRCHVSQFRVEPIYATTDNEELEVSSSITSSLLLKAEEAVKTLEFEVTGIEGVKWASLIRGTISGVPAYLHAASGLPSEEIGLVTFTAKVDEERGVIIGSTNVWGFYPEDQDARQFIDIYIWSNAGNFYLTQDVTEHMKNGQHSDSQLIILQLSSDLDLMDAAQGNSGFKPSINEWEEHNSNIQL